MSPPLPAPATVRIAEWQSCVRSDLDLTAADRQFLDRLHATGPGRVVVEELRAGLRLAATSWVGLLQFERFRVQVVPKLAGDNLGLVDLLEFTGGLRSLRRLPGVRTLAASGGDLLDLVVMVFADAVEELLAAGLFRDYVERDEDLAVVRGRLQVAEQALRHLGRVDRLACRFDEHEYDTVENRLVAAALVRAVPRVRDEGLRRRVRALDAVFSGVCSADLTDLAEAGGLVYHRLNEHYRDAHRLARLVLDGLGVTDVLSPGDSRCFAFLIDMNRLFERFVHLLTEGVLRARGYRVRSQHRDRSILWDATRDLPYASVVPDLLVGRPGEAPVPVDAKYKLYESGVDAGDLYQACLYAFAFGRRDDGRPPRAVLVHPATGGAVRLTTVEVRTGRVSADGEVRVIGIPVARALAEAKAKQVGPILRELIEAVEAGSPGGSGARIVGHDVSA